MKRSRILLVAAIVLTALFTFVFAGAASASQATTCTWQVVESTNVYYNSYFNHPQPSGSPDATAYLWRDGCGDVKATLTVLTHADQTDVFIQDAKGNIVGTEGTTSTAVYSGYAGVSLSVGGVVMYVRTDAPNVGVNYSAYNAGF